MSRENIVAQWFNRYDQDVPLRFVANIATSVGAVGIALALAEQEPSVGVSSACITAGGLILRKLTSQEKV